jgi:hypothetical protein
MPALDQAPGSLRTPEDRTAAPALPRGERLDSSTPRPFNRPSSRPYPGYQKPAPRKNDGEREETAIPRTSRIPANRQPEHARASRHGDLASTRTCQARSSSYPMPTSCSQRVETGTGSASSHSRPLNPTRRTFLVKRTRIESLTPVVANHDGVRPATVPLGTAKSLCVRWRVSKAGSSEPNWPPQEQRPAAAPAISPQSTREMPLACVRPPG